MTTPSTSIFIRSYRGDRDWLTYLLRSLQKFASGFLETVVALPVGDELHFAGYDFLGAKVHWYHDPPGAGYIGQQVCKLHADQMCDGEFILFLDSDCFVTFPMRPEMYFTAEGKPIHLVRHWADVGEDAKMWMKVTERFMGYTPTFEGMCCLPGIFNCQTFPAFREFVKETQKRPIMEYVQVMDPKEMSEFNALSAFIQRFQPYFYDFRLADPAKDGFPRVLQRWSWEQGGVHKYIEEYNRILAS